ncbi:MAG: DUF475 domain-containing protein, partial [Rhodococcus sp. (in: high G+C Gram-positive bacteria)]
ALAVILLVSIGYHVNENVTGLVGVALIGAAFISSIVRNRKAVAAAGAAEDDVDEQNPVPVG